MRLLKSHFPHLGFTLFESTMEDTHGDDLELCIIQDDGQLITYALQAKIIYHQSTRTRIKISNGKYPQMRHYVGAIRRENQVQLLLDYARPLGYVPMYLLYNYVFRPKIKRGIPNDLFGCTVVTAQYLKDNHGLADGNLSPKVQFTDLHPSPAFPWHELICKLRSLDQADLLSELDLVGYPLVLRDPNDALDNREWVEVDVSSDTPDGVTQKAFESLIKAEQRGANGRGFRPRFRLLFRPGGDLR
ncbi:hypothetical protein HQ865_24935 [Mucilaginibacter mali]|uniref:Uncharacterized protein n=1 Tax=Mucilaginibacter mali TaxID=2740462 RepID=A0A7D4QFZ2_9SPHI|nr:DUF6615 family protein [Mucilaginibacter mali]QKJ32864.1 hypothetical protein HQ865_24935 [Mucilaginibacter mali]